MKRKTESISTAYIGVSLVIAVFLVLLQGCLSGTPKYVSTNISGLILRDSDSTAVHGAYIIVERLDTETSYMGITYSEANGHYSYSNSYNVDNGERLRIHVTVVDVDGETGGVFVSQDSLLIWESTEGISEINVDLDFYVHMVGDSTDISGTHGQL